MVESIIIIHSPTCHEFESPGHPESPKRILNTYQYLKNQGYSFVEPTPAAESDVSLAHSQELVSSVKNNTFLDNDTPNIPQIYKYALLSVGGAVAAARQAHKGQPAFSLMRPPGHHAGINKLGGFCYFNNVAIAAKKILPLVKRLAILDIDCHHGQGTEVIVALDNNIIYVSLHQEGIYPGTGRDSSGNHVNFPLPAGTAPEKYLTTLDQALASIKKFKPKLLAISAGFDTYRGDPLTGLNLEIDTYIKIGKRIKKLKVPWFGVLEGGYSDDLPQCLNNFLIGLN